MLRDRHPHALGQPAPPSGPKLVLLSGYTAPMVVFQEGCATWNENLPLFMTRYRFLEEIFTFSYSPIKMKRGWCWCCSVPEQKTSQVLKGWRPDTFRRLSLFTERSDAVGDVFRLSAEIISETLISFQLIDISGIPTNSSGLSFCQDTETEQAMREAGAAG